jgi:leucyl-tRNA synthetase
VHQSDWPDYDESLLESETVTLVVQVDGKVRARLEAPAGMSDAEVEAAVLQDDKVRQWLNGRPVRKWVIVPDRLVNVVT